MHCWSLCLCPMFACAWLSRRKAHCLKLVQTVQPRTCPRNRETNAAAASGTRRSSWPTFSAAPREICAALHWALFYEDGPISSIPMCSRRLHGCRFLSMLAPQNAKPTAACRCLELRDVESVCTAFFQIRDTRSRTICPVSGAFCVSCKASRRDHEMRSAVLLLSSTLC